LQPDAAVLMADGTSKLISEIQTNDLVRTGSKLNNFATVKAVYSCDSTRVEEIDLAGTSSKLFATTEHLCWVDGKGWTAVSRLKPGDWLINSMDHRVQITGIKPIGSKTKVHTLRLSGDSAFYANDLLVHDLCGSQIPSTVFEATKAEVAK